MPHRFTSYPLPALLLLLLTVIVGLVCSNWLSIHQTASVLVQSERWLALFGFILSSQVLMGYLLWWLLRKRESTNHQTEVIQSIVHEFQSPITAIRMAVDILDSPIARNQPERTDKYVRIIREETERLQQQVETMLTLARADRNTLILNPEPIRVYQLLQSIAERHGNYLKLNLPGNEPNILADRLHLTNVFHNLLDNAIKYSGGEPNILIHTKNTTDGLTITVQDEGIGIAPKLVVQIFEPFFRVHDRNQPNVKGFGLGLSYVQRIMQSHNWTIWVKSELGKGSEFIIQVPPSALLPTPDVRQNAFTL